jgi:hypothetical protein
MRTRTLFLAILLIVCGRPSFAAPTPEQLRTDLQYVTRQLPAVHPNPFFWTSAADFQAAASRLDAETAQLSPEQFYTRLHALVAMLHDSHTSLRLDGNAAAAVGFALLPIQFRIFTDGVFVTAAPLDRPSLNRARLVHIGRVPVADVLKSLEPHVAHDNDSWLRAVLESLLSNAGILRGTGLAPAVGPIPFGFALPSGGEITVDISAGNSTPAVRSDDGYIGPLLERTGENYWSAYWPSARTVYVRYSACVEMANRPVTRFTADTLALVDDNPVDTLVVDLRGNGGGVDAVTIPLVVGLVQRIARLGGNPRFRVYTLIDGGTFSSGMNTAST